MLRRYRVSQPLFGRCSTSRTCADPREAHRRFDKEARSLIFTPTPLDGAYTIDIEPLEDERGFFARAWSSEEFAEHGLNSSIAQCNNSFNKHKGTLRGMHFQRAPHEEAKLVRCIRGSLYDVIVDLRHNSSTYRKWMGVELTADNRRMLYVPEGFAHGFQTLEDGTETFYMVTQPYVPGAEGGVRWNDPALGIEWPLEPSVMSSKDREWPDLDPG